jgi:hypothetical protein
MEEPMLQLHRSLLVAVVAQVVQEVQGRVQLPATEVLVQLMQ